MAHREFSLSIINYSLANQFLVLGCVRSVHVSKYVKNNYLKLCDINLGAAFWRACLALSTGSPFTTLSSSSSFSGSPSLPSGQWSPPLRIPSIPCPKKKSRTNQSQRCPTCFPIFPPARPRTVLQRIRLDRCQPPCQG